ncbi:DUF2971 domain-containing protein [Streptomyces sp. NBC_01788]|uniref:DUF2971 domain-containing protein n=1 Tax=Streptomyces sp. NBC_01788 TaxID=2975940 RepID=UPI002DD8D911|nr:DUF2971 domain-containing protein [Streptomyces sp. NBC_01788]WSB30949.1 DUF2971 domain-containing protein [Streptomyces sp. NBC_01788]
MTTDAQPHSSAALSEAALAFESHQEYEIWSAPRTLTGSLFHYTNGKGLSGILASGKLRLSPYQFTNDLWESQPHYPSFSQRSGTGPGPDLALWDEVDRQLRLHTKVGCLTQDVILPDTVTSPDALRGWAHLALWAHYGAGHEGVCLRFDRDRLVESFLHHSGPESLAFHGPVRYVSSQHGPAIVGIDMEQVAEFGIDAMSLAYAEANKDHLFLRKHIDWNSESEYRLVVLNQSVDYDYVDIRSALTGVVLGQAFPPERLPDLLAALDAYPGIEIQQIRFFNRSLHLLPFEGGVEHCVRPVSEVVWPAARRSGSLAERLQALRSAQTEAEARAAAGALVAEEHAEALEEGIGELARELSSWPGTEVETYPQSRAVPPQEHKASPGVPGEVVHYQRGFMCVVENLPKYSHTLVASAAVQVLDGRRLRLHAVVTTERWLPDGNQITEHWRGRQECPQTQAPQTVSAILNELSSQVRTVRPMFNQARDSVTGDE